MSENANNQGNPDQANAAANPEGGEPAAGFDIWETVKMFMLAYLLSSTLKAFSQDSGARPASGVPEYGAPGAHDQLAGLVDPTKDEVAQRGARAQFFYPMITPGQPCHFEAFLSFNESEAHWERYDTTPPNSENVLQPIWQNEWDITFDITPENNRQLNLTVPLNDLATNFHEMYSQNKTLYLHFQLQTPDMYDSTTDFSAEPKLQPLRTFRKSISMVTYRPRAKEEGTKNLMKSLTKDDKAAANETDGAKSDKGKDDKFYPHWKREIYLNVICDHTTYAKNAMHTGAMPPAVAANLKVDDAVDAYEPILYVSDFWHLKKDYVQLNDTLIDQSLNLTLNFKQYWVHWFNLQENFAQQHQQQTEWGMEGMDLDEMKRMFLETDKILLTVTMIVSCLHSVFEILAFKNDIAFWNKKESMEGISVKTLWFQLIQSLIILVYLFDNDTSWMILMSSGLGLILEGWKITQASKVTRIEAFPYWTIEDTETYGQSPTKEYDDIAMTYMSWASFPMIGCYTIYSFLYEEHKGLYAFVLNTLVGCIYTFGFINMTPQLYINYRLQSVEHMPGRALFYRFLNTIIDDLFSFIITMPTLHRLSCFRDDVIFVIYLYQRWAYRVDQTRGMYATEKPPHIIEQERLQALDEQKKKEVAEQREAAATSTTQTEETKTEEKSEKEPAETKKDR